MIRLPVFLLLALLVPALASAQTDKAPAQGPAVLAAASTGKPGEPEPKPVVRAAEPETARPSAVPAQPNTPAPADAAPAPAAPAPAAHAPAASAPAGKAAAPAPAAPASVPKASAPASTAASSTGKPEASPLPLAPDSVGAQVIAGVSDFMGELAADTLVAVKTARSIPSLWGWVQVMATDPLARETLGQVCWRLAVVFAIALALEWAARRVIARPRVALCRMGHRTSGDVVDPKADASVTGDEAGLVRAEAGETEPPRSRGPSSWTLLRRVPLVLARLVLDMLPVLVFTTAGHFVVGAGLGNTNLVRLTLLAVVDAYAVCRTIFVLARLLLSPRTPDLRLVPVGDATAVYAMRWIRRIVAVAIFGYAAAEIGRMFGMTKVAQEALLKAVALAVVVLLAIVVVQERKPVARRIAGDPSADGLFPSFRRRTASVWHLMALFYLGTLWLVWAVSVRNGFEQMLHVFLVILGVGIVARLLLIVLLGSLDRALHVRPDVAERYPGLEQRAQVYHGVLSGVLRGAIAVLSVLVLLQLWGFHALTWFGASLLGRRLLSSLGTIALTLALALAVWEGTNAAIQRHLAKLAKAAQMARSARLRTLLPLLRTALFIAIAAIVALTVLSEIGVDIAPLLAGAGIIGVAIGFGSQKLVQDLINGIFLLLENAMQVGDFVTVSGLSGTVEALSVRTIRLRAGDGSVHIIPFSAVTSVTNTNRGLGNAAVSVTVAYDEDTDHVGEVLKAIAVEMREEDAFRTVMLSDLQLWGVDKVDATSATLLGQIVCTDGGRWAVQREFNRRVKRRFQDLGIQMPTPVQDLVIRRSPWDAALQQVRPVQSPRLQEDGQG